MSFWNVPRMQQNNYGWGNAVADIAGAFIQRNQKQEDEQKAQKNMQSMLGLFQPSTVDTQTGTRNTVQFDPAIGKMQPEQPELYQPSLGMPSGLLAQNQPKQPMFQTELNPVPQAQQPQIQTPVIGQKMRTIRDVETDIRRDWATRLQEASKTVDPTMFRQYLPQLQQQMKLEIDQAKSDYSTQQINGMIAKMNGAKSLKEAAGYVTELSRLGVKVPVDLIKEQFATKKNELKFAPDGTMFLNGEMQGEKGQYGKPVVVRGYGGGGGGNGGNGNAKPKLGKAESWAANYEVNGLNRDQATIDTLYDYPLRTPAQDAQLQKAIANREQYWRISSGGAYGGEQEEQPQAEVQNNEQDVEAGYIQDALNNKVSPAQIVQGIQARAQELTAKGVNVNALLAMVEQEPQIIRPTGDFRGTD